MTKEITTTSFKFNKLIYKNFRAVCVTKGITTTDKIESLMLEYTRTHAAKASEHFREVATRIENA